MQEGITIGTRRAISGREKKDESLALYTYESGGGVLYVGDLHPSGCNEEPACVIREVDAGVGRVRMDNDVLCGDK